VMRSLKKIQAVYSENAPKPQGPYSQAILSNGFLFVAGQIGLDPQTGKLVDGIEEETKQTLRNIAAIVREAGADVSSIVKTTIYLTDMDHFALVNKIYEDWVGSPFPAR